MIFQIKYFISCKAELSHNMYSLWGPGLRHSGWVKPFVRLMSHVVKCWLESVTVPGKLQPKDLGHSTSVEDSAGVPGFCLQLGSAFGEWTKGRKFSIFISYKINA